MAINTVSEDLRSVRYVTGEWAGSAAVTVGAVVMCSPDGRGKFKITDVPVLNTGAALLAKYGPVTGTPGASIAVGDDLTVQVAGPCKSARVNGGSGISAGDMLAPGFGAGNWYVAASGSVAVPITSAAETNLLAQVRAYAGEDVAASATGLAEVDVCGGCFGS
jgi:hypothetical protein